MLTIYVFLIPLTLGQFDTWNKPCEESTANSNCDLRRSIQIYNTTIYSPDYRGIDREDCLALHKVWTQARHNWHFKARDKKFGVTAFDVRSKTVYKYTTTTTTTSGTPYASRITVSSSVITSTSIPDFAVPRYPIDPPCQVSANKDCPTARAKFQSANPVGIRNRPTWRDPTDELYPGCPRGCDRPVLTADGATLLYWPPGSTSTAGLVNIAFFEDQKLTSPTPYVAFDNLRGFSNCGWAGKEYKRALVTVPPEQAIKTGYGSRFHSPQSTRAVNYDDFKQPIPLSIYKNLVECGKDGANCKVPVVNAYNPRIQYPDAVRTVDPAWRKAWLNAYGISATPLALTPTGYYPDQTHTTSTS